MSFASFFEDVCQRYQEDSTSWDTGIRGPAGEYRHTAANWRTQRPKQASAFLVVCFTRLRELYAQVGRDLVDRFINGDWRALVIKLDGLRQRMDRFKLDVLWKASSQKMACADAIQQERDLLTECKRQIFDVLDKPFLEMSDVLSEIRVRLSQEKNPPLHKTDIAWCERVDEDCRHWGNLKTEADGWITLLEEKSL